MCCYDSTRVQDACVRAQRHARHAARVAAVLRARLVHHRHTGRSTANNNRTPHQHATHAARSRRATTQSATPTLGSPSTRCRPAGGAWASSRAPSTCRAAASCLLTWHARRGAASHATPTRACARTARGCHCTHCSLLLRRSALPPVCVDVMFLPCDARMHSVPAPALIHAATRAPTTMHAPPAPPGSRSPSFLPATRVCLTTPSTQRAWLRRPAPSRTGRPSRRPWASCRRCARGSTTTTSATRCLGSTSLASARSRTSGCWIRTERSPQTLRAC